MAIMLGGAAQGAAEKIKDQLILTASHNLQLATNQLKYHNGDVAAIDDPNIKIEWGELVEIAHRRFHDMPDGTEPGLQALCLGGANGWLDANSRRQSPNVSVLLF